MQVYCVFTYLLANTFFLTVVTVLSTRFFYQSTVYHYNVLCNIVSLFLTVHEYYTPINVVHSCSRACICILKHYVELF